MLAYNDAPTLPALIPRLRSTLSGLTGTFEILIVDDGSSDATARVAADLADRFSQVRLVRHEKNRGVGAAFRSGWEASRHEWVGYADGDNQYNVEDFVLLAEGIMQGSDMVSGRRARRADPYFRRIVSIVFNGAHAENLRHAPFGHEFRLQVVQTRLAGSGFAAGVGPRVF